MRKPQNHKLITFAVFGLVSQALLAFSLQQNNILLIFRFCVFHCNFNAHYVQFNF